ncbi:hypothetical protein P280DRAFT_153707 [Massarina eburnea CBS 473.64]|uniref:Uncharacterized protein n=1 Tax=Massarina eburnea CBS 473.64 TaxID=1395130 RepID=A0A6A6RLS4_9PLEO|nr:hypothetical protein P280DRAFT_153707 [Massarina eburnea CBS 473.64]
MAVSLDPGRIRCAHPRDIVEHLREVLNTSNAEEVTCQIIALVEHGSVPPSVFTMWLGLAQSPNTIKQALGQKASGLIRLLAIKRLRKQLCSSQWKEIWDSLGGVAGFLHLFSDMSKNEVKSACHAIRHSARGVGKEEKRKCFTEFFRALHPRLFATPHKLLDQRPLQDYYQILLPACTGEMVVRCIEDRLQNSNPIRRRHLLEHQAEVLQEQALRYAVEDHSAGEVWLTPLLTQYPSATAPLQGFSASMMFSLRVLVALVQRENNRLNRDKFMKELVTPLLKRALKRHVGWIQIHNIVKYTLICLQRNSELKELEYERQSFLSLVARCWSRKPELFAEQFRALLAESTRGSDKSIMADFIKIIHDVPRTRHYAVLEFCFKAIGGDIGNPEHLRRYFGVTPYSLLSRLSPGDALSLFNRLRSAKGDENLVERGPFTSVLGHSAYTTSDINGDPDIWQIVLLQRNGCQLEAEELASKQIKVCKKSAMTGSTPEKRAAFAKSVIFSAIASGSLDLYGQELIWARRYVRDPLVVAPLWQTHVDEAKALLSGIPERHLLQKGMLTKDLIPRIVTGNRILHELFDIAFTALREPSFAAQHWLGTLCLPFCIVQQRIKRSSELYDILEFSDKEVYDTLWKDTVETLVTLEKECLVSGRAGLNADSLQGILSYRQMTPVYLNKEKSSTYRFFDELAKARDEMWRQHRPTVYPAVTALPEPFPRGLPIQHLMEPYILQAPFFETHAPYLASRMDQAVFPDPKLASTPIPEDEDTNTAIGPFVDDYAYAIRLYIPATLDKTEKETRCEKVWVYATSLLSHPRLSADEANRYWGKDWPVHWTGVPNDTVWPIPPTVSNPTKVEEWNPYPPERSNSKSLTIHPLTYIDLSKAKTRHAQSPHINSVPIQLSIEVPGVQAEDWDIWSERKQLKAHHIPALREGLILSALLYLDTFNSSSTRILSKPFPSAEAGHMRYPALYLDDEFLATKDMNRYFALHSLRQFIGSVPPTLLAQVTKNTVNCLYATSSDAKGFVILEQVAFDLVKLLGKSDRPALASEIAVRCIIERPESSSRHRQILSHPFFERLSASDAHACISAFADAIIRKLEQQANVKGEGEVSRAGEMVPRNESESESDKTPFVKITTAKFLAQLLGDANFISQEFALAILSKLLIKTSHVDIHCTVVYSLRCMWLCPSLSPGIAEKILTALEVVIPLASNFNGRQPMTEADWANAEETLTPLDVSPAYYSTTYTADDYPLLELLLGFTNNHTGSQVPPQHGEFIARIIVPVLDALKQQNARWTSIFLRQQGFSETDIKDLNIPSLPAHQKIIEKVLLTSCAYIPLSLLEEYIAYLNFNIAPPAPIATLNKKLYNDTTLRTTPDVKYYLGAFAAGPNITTFRGNSALFSNLLEKPEQLQNHITPQHVQQNFLRLLTLLLWNDGYDLINVYVLMGSFCKMSPSYPIAKTWADFKQPVVEAAVVYVEGLRTRDWERDDERQPAFLPDTWLWRMWLLQYAARHSAALEPDPQTPGTGEKKGKQRDAHCAAFASRVSKLTDAMAGSLYHKRLARLEIALKYLTGEDKLRVACHLGDIKTTRLSWLTKQDLLRVELAAGLVREEGPAKDGELEGNVRELVVSWKKCSSEEVRRLAVEINTKRLNKQGGIELFD